jgi:hypothetical protein
MLFTNSDANKLFTVAWACSASLYAKKQLIDFISLCVFIPHPNLTSPQPSPGGEGVAILCWDYFLI